MMPWWAIAIFVFGVNVTLWGSVGLLRLAETGLMKLRWRSAARRFARLRHAPKPIPPGAAVHSQWLAAGMERQLPAGAQDQVIADMERQLAAGAQHRRAVPSRRERRTAPPVTTGGRRPAVRPAGPVRRARLTTDDVAVLIPAHNEAAVIGDSLQAIMEHVPPRNIHVISDASTDETVAIARAAGAKVLETSENLGKAGALEEAIGRFRLIERFPLVMLLDADTRIEPGYFAAALPIFSNPEVVAVAGCVRTAGDRTLSFAGQILTGHRRRIYAMGQRLLKYGQTWLRVNATHIVPGFASLYRTDVLPYIDMNPPGLVIEDFNMTFEVYQKRLGKVGFTLGAVAVTQDPDNLRDYVRQTKRWALGFWQTVRRHPPRANLFTAMVWVLLIELVTSSMLFLVLPLLLLILGLPALIGGAAAWPLLGSAYAVLSAHLTLSTILYGVALPDLAMTCMAAITERRPSMLLFAAFFPVMRVIDSVIGLYAIPLTFLSKSNGRWKSPTRRAGPASLEPRPLQQAGPGPSSADMVATEQLQILRPLVRNDSHADT